MHAMPALAGALFRFFTEEKLEYCVLGDLRDFPASLEDSLDLVVSETTLARIPAVLKAFTRRHDLQLATHRRDSEGVDCYGLAWLDREQRPCFVGIHVRSHYQRCSRIIFTADELLQDRVPAADVAEHGRGYFMVAPAKEFACHLLQCLDRGVLSERDARHLSDQWRLDAEGVAKQIGRFWNPAREGGVVLRAAASGNWEAVQASARALRSALRLHNVVPPTTWLRARCSETMERWRHPSGLLIACLGPDGSGKTSVIRALRERPMTPFRGVHAMELRPRMMRPGPVKDVNAPHARVPRGKLGTMAKLAMFVADYWLGYWLQIRPKLVRSTLVVSDRYFDDVLVDPIRYRMRRPRALTRMLLRWVPRPELWLVFDLPSEVLQARQADIEADEAVRQRAEYRRVLRGDENIVMLDASQPLEKVVAQAERAIARQLSRRTAIELGLPRDTVENPAKTNFLLFFCRRDVPLLSRLIRVVYNSDIQCRLPPDLHLPHPYGIVIHPQAVIGQRVTVMQQATIGGKDRSEKVAPIIGDDVYVGAGARVLGDVRIGRGAVIGANAVVTRDIPAGATVVGANRIVSTERPALVATHNASVARLDAQRGRRTHLR
jgi:serine acetyltransferase/thymidylate kinase